MTIDQLKVFLENLTYEDFEKLVGENPAWSVLEYVEAKDKNQAVHMFITWLNENRTDGGYTQVLWGKKAD